MDFSIIPGRRISNKFKPEIKILAINEGRLSCKIFKEESQVYEQQEFLHASIDYQKVFINIPNNVKGNVIIEVILTDEKTELKKAFPYEILCSEVKSTTLLDGCWLSFVHWSESEARHFNKSLRQINDLQWEEIIEDMHEQKIYGIMIQNMFDNDEYVFEHNQGLENYLGKAFYPSKLYSNRYTDMCANDPLEHVLAKADELDMQVFVGVGLYAWFDFSKTSLEWHKKVAAELYEQYGHHKSFYSFYISEEIHGSFYDTYAPTHKEEWTDVAKFFQEFADYIKELAPTKPISFAPNNIRFHEFVDEWTRVLRNIDIILPFAFARDLEHLNIKEIQSICDTTGTHFWVDMEIFQYPLEETGLIPKSGSDLIKEIRYYDEVENIFGYQYNGLLNNPQRDFCLGEKDTIELYNEYANYLNYRMSEMSK